MAVAWHLNGSALPQPPAAHRLLGSALLRGAIGVGHGTWFIQPQGDWLRRQTQSQAVTSSETLMISSVATAGT